jgi:hypothetical protein
LDAPVVPDELAEPVVPDELAEPVVPDEPAEPVDPDEPDEPPDADDTGVTVADAVDADDVPPEFVAVAVNVYEVPLLRPVTVHDPLAPVTVHVAPPGEAVTVYESGVPPKVGATTVTVACPSPATTVGCPGVPGAAFGMIPAARPGDGEEL